MKKRILYILTFFIFIIIANIFHLEWLVGILIIGLFTYIIFHFLIIGFNKFFYNREALKNKIGNVIKIIITYLLLLSILILLSINVYISTLICIILITFTYKYINKLVIYGLSCLFFLTLIPIYYSICINIINITKSGYYDETGILLSNYEFFRLIIKSGIIYDTKNPIFIALFIVLILFGFFLTLFIKEWIIKIKLKKVINSK